MPSFEFDIEQPPCGGIIVTDTEGTRVVTDDSVYKGRKKLESKVFAPYGGVSKIQHSKIIYIIYEEE